MRKYGQETALRNVLELHKIQNNAPNTTRLYLILLKGSFGIVFAITVCSTKVNGNLKTSHLINLMKNSTKHS